MPLTKAPVAYPFTSAAVIEIFSDGGSGPKYVGSVFLIKTAKHNRQDIVLGAGHNLSHLSDKDAEVHVTIYGNRDVNSIAVKGDGGYRYAVAGAAMPKDFGVAVLAEALSDAFSPIPLRSPPDATTIAATPAGGVADKVSAGDRSIYQDTTDFKVHGDVLYCAPDITAPGMSGGPVIDKTTDPASGVGVIHGTGTVSIDGGDPKPADLAVAMTADAIKAIDALIDAALG